MMRKITLFAIAMWIGLTYVFSQAPSSTDWNGFVDSKNTGLTGYFNLSVGNEESAGQTYHYSGPGKVSQVKVFGHYPFPGGVPLRISVYSVDALGRPVSELSHVNDIFWNLDNNAGYITASLPTGGTPVNSSFAIVISIRNAWPYGNLFQLKYTGDGEGQGQDLSSLSGTSTGFNWTSAKDNFTKDGDFYLLPRMTHFNTTNFTNDLSCVGVSSPIQFTNSSQFTQDSMFNKINLSSYTGSNFLYSWDFGDGTPLSHQENPTHSFTTPGSYSVTLKTTIEGWSGTSFNTHTNIISVGLNVNSAQVVNPVCNGESTGSVSVTGSGGTSPYTYSINNGNYQSSSTFSNLPAGNYVIKIKDSNRCTSTTNVVITQPQAIDFSTVSSSNASCGNSDGSILVSANGGAGNFQYKLNSGAYQTSGSFSGLSAGSYTITVRDANTCTNSIVEIVNNTGSPSLSILSTTNVSCNGGNDGTIVLNATGGVGNLQYSINGGSSFQSSTSFLGLASGSYSILVKDASGCTSGTTLSITQPNLITYSVSSSETFCNGSSDGQVQVNSVSGGIGIFSYSINGISYQSSSMFSGLSAGTYTVYVRDAASCIKQSTISVSQPNPVTAALTINDAGCNGYYTGSISISPTGGTSPYTYSIEQGVYQTESLFDNLPASTYSVTVMDHNNCTYSVTAVVSQPPILNASISTTNSTCGSSNGSILAIANGGSGAGYQYSLDGINYNSSGLFSNKPAGIYYVVVRDGSGCNRILPATVMDSDGPVITSSSFTDVGCFDGMDGTITVNTVSGGTGALTYSINGIVWQSSTTFMGLSSGIYTVYVKDVNSCIGTEMISISQPNAFVISKTINHVTCNGGNNGSVNILAAGGSGTMAYSIDNGITFQSSNVFSNLPAGSYLVKIRDAAGCIAYTRFTIVQPPAIAIFTGHLDVSCYGLNNGQITAYASGGIGSLSYSLDGLNYQSSNIFSNLDAGNYVVYVKDGNSCVRTSVVAITEPLPLVITPFISNVSCAGGNDGVINLTVSGGSGSNSYTWSNGANTEDLFSLTVGLYSVGITDKNGCSAFASFTVTEPQNPLIVNAVVAGTPSNTGSVDATITGGTMPYQYSWNTGDNTEDISGLTPGFYILTVTDALGCTTTGIYFVDNTTGLSGISGSDSEFTVYPNPASETILVSDPSNLIEKIYIFNSIGQLLIETNSTNTKTELSISNLEEGMYILKLQTRDKIFSRRIQVVK